MKSDDELLDEITAYLRHEQVPEMPQQLMLRRRTRRHGVWWAAAVGTLAASCGGLLIWRTLPDVHRQSSAPGLAQQAPKAIEKSEVVVLPVDLAAPIGQLEAHLDQFEDELADLRWQASLLEARRKADELLAQF